MNSLADDFREMIAAWEKITTAAKKEFPNATDEELYQIAHSAMMFALGFNK